MVNISQLVQKIRDAIYGEEVRGSIADGIEGINQKVDLRTGLFEVWVETTTNASYREVTVNGVTSLSDLLNKPLYIRSRANGLISGGTLNINSYGHKNLLFPNIDDGGISPNPPTNYWTRVDGIYQVVWNGTGFIVLNTQLTRGSTSYPGILQLGNSYTNSSTTMAASLKAVKDGYDAMLTALNPVDNKATEAYALATQALATSGVGLSGKVYAETSSSANMRTVTIPGITKMSDILNVPIFISTDWSGNASPTTLSVNGFQGAYISFPKMNYGGAGSGETPLSITPPADYWVRAKGVYNVVWNGTSFILLNFQISEATETTRGIVALINSTSSLSTTAAATASSVKLAYDKAVDAYNLALAGGGVGPGGGTDISSKVWAETSTDAVIRTVTISGVTSWADILNKPLFIKSSSAGISSTSPTLNVNNLGAKNIYFPSTTGSGLVGVAAFPNWVRSGGVYCVVWNGTYLILVNLQIQQSTTSALGVVKLDETLSDINTTAATPKLVKSVYAKALEAYELAADAYTLALSGGGGGGGGGEEGVIVIPQAFPSIPFEFYRDVDNQIKHDHTLSQYKIGYQEIYVNLGIGNDNTGNGSASKPFQRMQKAFDVAEAGSADSYIIRVSGNNTMAMMTRNFSEVVKTTTKNISVVGDTETKMILSTASEALAWSISETGTGTWRATRSGVYAVFGLEDRDAHGEPMPYDNVLSLETCKAQKGSWYQNGSDVWIHTNNELQPTIYTHAVCIDVPLFNITISKNNTIYFENLRFIAGRPSNGVNIIGNGQVQGTFVSNNCSYLGSNLRNVGTDEKLGNALSTESIKNVYNFNGVAAYSGRDGFNYHYEMLWANETTRARTRECITVEYNCLAYECGLYSNTGADNTTTSHDGACIIRVGCNGYRSSGPVLHDTMGCLSYCIDCYMRESLYSGNIPMRKTAYFFENYTAVELGTAWLINCRGGGDNYHLSASEGFTVYLRNFTGANIYPDLNITYF